MICPKCGSPRMLGSGCQCPEHRRKPSPHQQSVIDAEVKKIARNVRKVIRESFAATPEQEGSNG